MTIHGVVPCLLGFAAGACFAIPAAAQGGQLQEFVLAKDVQEIVAAHAAAARPVARLASIQWIQTIDHRANFRKVRSDVDVRLEPLDSGLYGVQEQSVMADGKASSSGRALSLCGLFPVMSASGSVTDTLVTTVLPVGKVFLPFGIPSTAETSTRLRLTGFSASVASVCDVAPGAVFSFKVEQELLLTTSGLFGGTKTIKRVDEASCEAAGSTEAATRYGRDFTGEALAVNCSYVTGDRKRQMRHVYLQDARYYLPAEANDEWQKSTFEYPKVTYAAPGAP